MQTQPHITVVAASEFADDATGFRLAWVTGEPAPHDLIVPGWFEDTYPEMAEVKATADEAAAVARGLGFEVRAS